MDSDYGSTLQKYHQHPYLKIKDDSLKEKLRRKKTYNSSKSNAQLSHLVKLGLLTPTETKSGDSYCPDNKPLTYLNLSFSV